jgi:hypothetical protein
VVWRCVSLSIESAERRWLDLDWTRCEVAQLHMFDVGCCARSRRNMCIHVCMRMRICYHDKYRWRLHGAPRGQRHGQRGTRTGLGGSGASADEALGRPTRISLHHTRHGYEFTYAWAVHAAARITGSHEAQTAGIHIPWWRTWSQHIVIDRIGGHVIRFAHVAGSSSRRLPTLYFLSRFSGWVLRALHALLCRL